MTSPSRPPGYLVVLAWVTIGCWLATLTLVFVAIGRWSVQWLLAAVVMFLVASVVAAGFTKLKEDAERQRKDGAE